MDREAFRFRCPLRVRFAEADPQGIVFNGNYFLYFDVAFTEYMRAIDANYLDLIASGTDVVVLEAKCRFHAGARPDDELRVGVRVAHLGRTSLVFEFRIDRDADATLIATGQIAYVCIQTGAPGRSKAIPDSLRAAILAWEGDLSPPASITPMLDRFAPPVDPERLAVSRAEGPELGGEMA